MKIKYLVCSAGSDFVRNVGDIADVDDAEGLRYVAAGYAEIVPVPESPPDAHLGLANQTGGGEAVVKALLNAVGADDTGEFVSVKAGKPKRK